MKRALLIIDVQNEHISGALAATYPSLHVSMPNIAMLMDSAADHKLTTVVVQRMEQAGSPHFARGSRGAALHPLIADNPRDALVLTSGPLGSGEEQIGSWLRERSITTVTLAGFTVEGALTRIAGLLQGVGLQVEVLADATGAHDPADASLDARAIHERSLDALEHSTVTVGTTSAWEDAIDSGAPLPSDRVITTREGERPSHKRAEFERIEADLRAHAENLEADAEAFRIQHTFALGVQPL